MGPKEAKNFDFEMGNMVDMYLFTPELFDEEYYMADTQLTVSDRVREIITEAYTLSKGAPISHAEGIILQVAKEKSYMPNIKSDASLLNNILQTKNGKDHYEFLIESGGKKVITSFQKAQIIMISNKLQAAIEHIAKATGTKFEYQVPLYFQSENLSCKGLLDVKFSNQDVVFQADTKVTDMTLYGWTENARTFRYDFQAAFYQEGLKFEASTGLTPEPTLPKLIVYSTVDDQVGIFELTEMDLMIGKYGGTIPRTIKLSGWSREQPINSTIYGFMDAIELYRDYLYNVNFKEPIIKINNGIWYSR